MKKLNISKELPFQETLQRMKEHRRFRVFYHKGTSCVKCGVQGTRIYQHLVGKKKESHIDLFTDLGELMTIDHIYPKSKGGKNLLINLQPMCEKCNVGKNIETKVY